MAEHPGADIRGDAPMKLHLVRTQIGSSGAFGGLLWNMEPWLVTVEKTYPFELQNGPVVQQLKIPAGTYRCTHTMFHRGGYWTCEIHVPGHTRILFHRANWETDLDGCVGLGSFYAQNMVVKSRAAHDAFMERLKDVDEFELEVLNG